MQELRTSLRPMLGLIARLGVSIMLRTILTPSHAPMCPQTSPSNSAIWYLLQLTNKDYFGEAKWIILQCDQPIRLMTLEYDYEMQDSIQPPQIGHHCHSRLKIQQSCHSARSWLHSIDHCRRSCSLCSWLTCMHVSNYYLLCEVLYIMCWLFFIMLSFTS